MARLFALLFYFSSVAWKTEAFRARTQDLKLSEDTFGFVPQIVQGKSTKVYGNYTLEVLKRKIAEFAPVTVTTDISGITETEKKVLDLLINAAKYMNPIFNRQMFRWYNETREKLSQDGSELAKAQLEFFDIMRGPWDRQEEEKPFAVEYERPLGAGGYPINMTKESFESHIANHPEEKENFENLVTIVLQKGDKLVANNYSYFFQEYLRPAHNNMIAAAALTENQSLKTFLQSRAKAFLSNDYFQSDKDWMDLDSRIEITIGPYETYQDKLMALKASFEAFVTVTDPVESEKLSKYKSLLPEMEQNLPIPDDMKTERGSESPIRVVDLVYSSGEARKAVQTLAFNLPNDERVRKEKGAKKVMLKNNIISKFDQILTPIANKLMKQKQISLLDQEAFFNNVLFHELSHSLGPAFVGNNKTNGEIRAALGASYSGLEEGKADVMGVYNTMFMVKKGELPEDFKNKALFTYIAGLFRSIRFGVVEAHGKGAAMQLNTYLKEGSVVFLPETGTYQVNFKKLEDSIKNLVKNICTWQHNGDKEAVDKMFEEFAKLDENTLASLELLKDIPVDIRPCYPLAGEQC
eukprot:TRINITY_DN1362_c0_g1_i1.p1 TRINITY_DN1362_c0_g1~~TRINITY_DN1362_c0_g1_i1.p1  ORF type:complete len:580 (+),score=152.83 TRINITY_DN1362_c0_g1_i1:100-1839(+)